jgi:methionine-S-sulfoxide reductase
MDLETAIFGAGCFWGVQFYFDQIPGVIESRVGYSGGKTENPTYEDVCSHTTGHAEVVELSYDPDLIGYETLLKHFFRLHDPTQLNRQGPDIGDNYRSVVFYTNSYQKETAERIKKSLATEYDAPIVTEVTQADIFYPAEDYHQKYAERTGHGMCHVPYEPLQH